jgi:hypothetical protein
MRHHAIILLLILAAQGVSVEDAYAPIPALAAGRSYSGGPPVSWIDIDLPTRMGIWKAKTAVHLDGMGRPAPGPAYDLSTDAATLVWHPSDGRPVRAISGILRIISDAQTATVSATGVQLDDGTRPADLPTVVCPLVAVALP